MKFREHRGGLRESMETVVDIPSRQALVAHVIDKSRPYERQLRELIERHGIEDKPYTYDDRIGWNTYIVTLEGYGVLGFTDGPLADANA